MASKHFLLLCNRPVRNSNASTITEHIDAVKAMPGWVVREVSMLGAIPEGIDLARFDAVGVHYTLHLSEPGSYFLNESALADLEAFRGLKCAWLHDEYRRVEAVRKVLKRVGVSVIFSLADGELLETLYPSSVLPGVRKETVFAGYVPASECDGRFSSIEILHRPIDVGYRARRPPLWLGALGQEKINIGLGFMRHPESRGLALDISVEEGDRLYGESWKTFLGRCKAVLCVESGASVIDFTGDIEEAVNAVCASDPDIGFLEIRSRYLSEIDGRYLLNPVSPRVFEAAAAGAVLICFAGRYSGVIEPWKHYIPLEKDFSNMAQVRAALGDPELLWRLSSRAHKDLVMEPRYGYSEFSNFCAEVLHEECSSRLPPGSPVVYYSDEEFHRALHVSRLSVAFGLCQQLLQKILLGSSLRGPVFRLWYRLPGRLRARIRPLLRVIGR